MFSEQNCEETVALWERVRFNAVAESIFFVIKVTIIWYAIKLLSNNFLVACLFWWRKIVKTFQWWDWQMDAKAQKKIPPCLHYLCGSILAFHNKICETVTDKIQMICEQHEQRTVDQHPGPQGRLSFIH